MSGHSKWSTIKHKKGLNDAKKGKAFSKYAQLITVAAREGGADLDSNPQLRLLVDKAKSESMPVDKIKRAIDRGVGNGADGPVIFEACSYEGFGPEGVSVIVDVLTENRNRAVADIRNIFNESGGNLGDNGSVSWNFDVKGMVLVRCGKIVPSEKYGEAPKLVDIDPEQVELAIMDVEGAQDIVSVDLEDGKGLEVYCKLEYLGRVRDAIGALGYVVREAQIIKVPKLYKEFTQEQIQRVYDFVMKLDEYQDVQNVWIDVNPDDLDKIL